MRGGSSRSLFHQSQTFRCSWLKGSLSAPVNRGFRDQDPLVEADTSACFADYLRSMGRARWRRDRRRLTRLPAVPMIGVARTSRIRSMAYGWRVRAAVSVALV